MGPSTKREPSVQSGGHMAPGEKKTSSSDFYVSGMSRETKFKPFVVPETLMGVWKINNTLSLLSQLQLKHSCNGVSESAHRLHVQLKSWGSTSSDLEVCGFQKWVEWSQSNRGILVFVGECIDNKTFFLLLFTSRIKPASQPSTGLSSLWLCWLPAALVTLAGETIWLFFTLFFLLVSKSVRKSSNKQTTKYVSNFLVWLIKTTIYSTVASMWGKRTGLTHYKELHTEVSQQVHEQHFKRALKHGSTALFLFWNRGAPRRSPSLWGSMNNCLLGSADASQSGGITLSLQHRWGPSPLVYAASNTPDFH